MDKKLLDALNNLSVALEILSMNLEETRRDKNRSSTSTALTSQKLEKKIDLIDKGVKQLQSDNKKILKNQSELLRIAKSQQKSGPIGDAADPKQRNKIKDGLATVLMIAVGVLAIGLAFKIIGKVNFLSVIALAIALPLIAIAFQKISESKMNPKDAFVASLVMTVASLGIVSASWILSMIKPLSIAQLFTAAAISAAFYFIGPAFGAMIQGMLTNTEIEYKGMKGKKQALDPQTIILGSILVPLVMIAASIGIVGASHVLGFVKPLGLAQALTAILIAVAFGFMAKNIGAMVQGFKDVDPDTAAVAAVVAPLLLIAMSMAIAASSWFLQLVKPVGFFKLLTSIFIGIVFVALSYCIPMLAKALKKIKVENAYLIPVIFVLLALAIMLTSYLFNMVMPVPILKLFNILVQGVVLAVIGVAFSYAINHLKNIKPQDALKAGLIMVIIAGVIVATSYLLSLGTYEKYPSLDWALGVGLSIAAFGLGAFLLGQVVAGPQALLVAAGLLAIVVIAGVIVGTSYILAAGKYDKYPGLDWSIGVAASIGGFALMAAGIGLLMAGPQALLFALGAAAVVGIAYGIVEVSKVLAKGIYGVQGFDSWVNSVVYLYSNFTLIYARLGSMALAGGIIAVFGGKSPFKRAGEMILEISDTIVEVSKKLTKGVYVGGPTREWADSISLALGAFSPIYKMLQDNNSIKSLILGGVTPEDYNKAIKTIVEGIVFAANSFAGFAEKPYPKKEWSEGVGLAISTFSPVYEILAKSKGWFTSGPTPEQFKAAIMIVSQGIVDAAEFFAKNTAVFKKENVPPKEWSEGVGGALSAFSPALEFITKNAGWWSGADPKIIKKAIAATTEAIVDSAFTLSFAKFSNPIPKEWVDGTSAAVKGFVDLASYIYERRKWLHKAIDDLGWVTSSMVTTSSRFRSIMANAQNISAEPFKGMKESVKLYVETAYYVQAAGGEAGYLTKKPIFQALDTLGWVTLDMVKTAKRFKEMSGNLSNVDENWMLNVASNVKTYVALANWLSGNNVDRYVVSNTVSSMNEVARSYERLASAISKLNSQLQEMDPEKLNALRSLNSSVVLMSLMDPEQFKSMMDELEERGGVLIDALKDLEGKEGGTEGSGGTGGASTTQVKSSSTQAEAQKTISDLYTIMQSVDTKLGSIASSSDKLAKYVDEIRGDDPLIRK